MTDKAVWDDTTTKIFIHACLDQIYAKEWRVMSFSKDGWAAIVSTFNEKTGRGYDRKQLKNKFNILRKDLKTWDTLLNKTGLSRDPETGALNTTTEWWRQKCQENLGYKKFCQSPLKFESELRIIFKDVYVIGEASYCPSFRHASTKDAEDIDVYRQTMGEEEGSGDSEDDSFAAHLAPTTGVSDDLAGIGLSFQSGPSMPTDLGSQGKRKMVNQSASRKKPKTPVANWIADAVSIIANTSRDRAATISGIRQWSVDTVMKDLLTLEEVQAYPRFRIRCIELLTESKSRREAFAFLYSDNKEYLVKWLRFAVARHFG